MKLQLIRPTLEYYSSYMAMIEEMRQNSETVWAPYLPKENESPESFIARSLKRETDPEVPYVPETIYWALADQQIVGRISLRHFLDENLAEMGGHIGFEVRPSARQKGYAKEMLKLVLETELAQQIGRLLLTCAPSNLASNKTIQANGGVLKKTIYVDRIKAERHHYWITVF